ncbi:transcriptional regulator with XRE-family HTH domain [Alkalihalobacillus xiaoxiensis]|uniref:Transcriptional regulator with XRE-family HTH domain n=1 Tax=Shouchella xiaoxiensis TaxID=766895 RepID=A0ABS2SWJ8_9BACI|nr:helix-turn-helix transcriptional regulator [Shouchella xiaoxiensis]MBM7839912.1 transcriptional regulator with XRE-family HTH domain [Shouchella xiaoxiensis]
MEQSRKRGKGRRRSYGENRLLIALRKEQNWTQTEVASRLSISQSKLSRIELNIDLPSLEVEQKLTQLYKVPSETLFPQLHMSR